MKSPDQVAQPFAPGTKARPVYWAFVSYSHRDQYWGEWLHKSLERYRVPHKLVGRSADDGPIPRRLFPIFRDCAELPAAANLGARLDEALRRSRYLVVVLARGRGVALGKRRGQDF